MIKFYRQSVCVSVPGHSMQLVDTVLLVVMPAAHFVHSEMTHDEFAVCVHADVEPTPHADGDAVASMH